MASIERTWRSATSPRRLWDVAADPLRFEDWLTLHRSWQGAAPAEFLEGLEITAVLSLLNIPLTVVWTVQEYDPPRHVRLTGTSAAGIAVAISLGVTDDGPGGGATVTIRAELTGQLMDGAFGPPLERAAREELDRSLAALGSLVAR